MTRIQDNLLQRSISHALTRLFREQSRLHGRALEPLGVSTEQAHLLLVLFMRGPLTMTELGREVALSSGTVSAAIDRMEASGLVRRVADPADRRAVRVEPAAWSKARRERLYATVLATEATLLTPLGAKEQATLLGLLTRLLEGLAASGERRDKRTSPRSKPEP
jgi:DNA-binding MarR family transcriptional regulator